MRAKEKVAVKGKVITEVSDNSEESNESTGITDFQNEDVLYYIKTVNE